MPSIRVFRRGIISEYRGPLDSEEGIADFLREDSLVRIISMLYSSARNANNTMILQLAVCKEDLEYSRNERST